MSVWKKHWVISAYQDRGTEGVTDMLSLGFSFLSVIPCETKWDREKILEDIYLYIYIYIYISHSYDEVHLYKPLLWTQRWLGHPFFSPQLSDAGRWGQVCQRQQHQSASEQRPALRGLGEGCTGLATGPSPAGGEAVTRRQQWAAVRYWL